MLTKQILEKYDLWIMYVRDNDIMAELQSMCDAEIEDAFYCDLSFGTGGLRGIIGAGTNRMNIYTVAKASQGLADYVRIHFSNPSIAISYDSRIKSDEFSKVAGSVFAANGIKVYLYPELMPTPLLSYAVRALNCSAGVMITASHNPAQYNGYKVYGSDGCQITIDVAKEVQEKIEKQDIFNSVRTMEFQTALTNGSIEYIKPAIYGAFIDEIKKQSVLYGDEVNRDFAIVYSPLNGTGLKPVTRILQENGFTNIVVVSEQEQPDGNFPTCSYPNPEMREAMELGLRYCEKANADIFLATDPDCDRCGIAVKGISGYQLLTGNEVGLLLLDFICSQRQKHGKMPDNPVFVKTIVTTDLAEKIAMHYGVQIINVLTGFKFIGETIGSLEDSGRELDYICGFEESYGYLTGTYVRDKDAVNAVFMICEMFAYYKTRGISLVEKLEEIYKEYGYCLNTLHSYEFSGSQGMARMCEIMQNFRTGVSNFGGIKVEKILDYEKGVDGLPKADVLKYFMKNGSVVIRPSGTEPKLKVYISVMAENGAIAERIEKKIIAGIEECL